MSSPMSALSTSRSSIASPRHLPSRRRLRISGKLVREESLKTRQLKVADMLGRMRRTIKTTKASEALQDLVPDQEDSFAQRFNQTNRTYSHRLIGEVKLPYFARNDVGELCKDTFDAQEKGSKSERRLETTHKVKFLEEIKESRRKVTATDRLRKVMSSISHLRKLNIAKGTILKIPEIIPNKPYGLTGSQEFFKAIKEGDFDKCKLNLNKNVWLAQTRDHIEQTGLHWAARRNSHEIVKLLIDHGCFVDARDNVSAR